MRTLARWTALPLAGTPDLALSLLLLTAAHTAWSGYRFGDSNHAFQVPLIKHYADGTLYPGDALFIAASGHTSLFFPGIGLFVRAFGNLEVVYFTLFLAAKLAGLWALWSLSLLVFENRKSAALLLFVSLGETLSLGGEPLRAPRLTHGELACSLLLWAIVLYLRGRPFAAHLLAGLVFNVHAVFAVTVLSMFALDGLIGIRRTGARSLLTVWGVFLLVASPTLVWMLRAAEPFDPKWVELFRLRSAEHSFPLSTWGPERYSSFLLLLAVGTLGLRRDAQRGLEQKLLHFSGAVALLCFAGIVFTEWIPTKAAIQGQLTRSARLLTDLALLYIAQVFLRAWQSGTAGKLAAVVGFLAVAFPTAFGGYLPFVLAFLLLYGARELSAAPALFGCGALAFYGLYPAHPFPERLGIGQLTALLRQLSQGPVWICLALFVAWRLALQHRRLVALAAVMAAGWPTLYQLPAQYRSLDERLRQTSWVQVQLWARENTAKTGTFITPPDGTGFRVFSERPVVGEWKDGTMAFFSDRFAFEWWQRMQDLGLHDRKFETFDERHFLEIAERYGAGYLVFPVERKLGFQELYANRQFAIYRMSF